MTTLAGAALSLAVAGAWAAAAAAALALAAIVAIRYAFFSTRTEPSKCSVAFFHPYCDAGGGGERVLWAAIQSLAACRDAGSLKVVVYTGDVGTPPESILAKARERFGLALPPPELDLEFVYVTRRRLLEAALYPRFTMLGQSLGSMALAWECLRAFTPDVFIDTTGCHFTFVVAKLLAGCRVGAYVHYPTITTDMLAAVYERRPSYNNNADVAGSRWATAAKAAYYRAFAALYAFTGGLCDATLCNSSWTKGHIDSLWRLPGPSSYTSGGSGTTAGVTGRVAVSPTSSSGGGGSSTTDASPSLSSVPPLEPDATGALLAPLARGCGARRRPPARIVYPPCNTDALSQLPLAGPDGGGDDGGVSDDEGTAGSGGRERIVVSVGQFRPEKDHPLQLRAFAAFRARDPARFGDVRLVLIGGCRGAEDEGRVAGLKALACELGLRVPQDVQFVVNAPLGELRAWLGRATAGLHTMWNEHFGICVVELMAAGVVPIAHDSGGPRADIVVPFHGHSTGYLAATETQYADALAAVFSSPPAERLATAAAGRASVARFSDEEFLLSFYAGVAGLLRAGLGDLRARRAAAATAAGGGGGGGVSSGASSGGGAGDRKRW